MHSIAITFVIIFATLQNKKCRKKCNNYHMAEQTHIPRRRSTFNLIKIFVSKFHQQGVL